MPSTPGNAAYGYCHADESRGPDDHALWIMVLLKPGFGMDEDPASSVAHYPQLTE